MPPLKPSNLSGLRSRLLLGRDDCAVFQYHFTAGVLTNRCAVTVQSWRHVAFQTVVDEPMLASIRVDPDVRDTIAQKAAVNAAIDNIIVIT